MKIWEAIKYPVGTKFNVTNYNMWPKIRVAEVGKTKTLFWDAPSDRVAITEDTINYELEIDREEITWQEAMQYEGRLILDISGIENLEEKICTGGEINTVIEYFKRDHEIGAIIKIISIDFFTQYIQEIILEGKWYKE